MKKDISIDIGTKNTYIYAVSQGSIVCESSAAAVDIITGKPVALGADACQLVMRTPGCNKLVYPLLDGETADGHNIDFMARLLGYHTARYKAGRFSRPRVAVSVPPNITEEDEAILTRAVLEAGASEAVFIESPLAAVTGAGRDAYTGAPTAIVDAGASKTSAAIVADGKVLYYTSVSAGGNAIDTAICDILMSKYKLSISDECAEELKTRCISLDAKQRGDKAVAVNGIAIRSGLPVTAEVRVSELSAAALVPAMAISEMVRGVIDNLEPDYNSSGEALILTGGTAMLSGLAEFITAETGMSAAVADNPVACAALGLGMGLDRMEMH